MHKLFVEGEADFAGDLPVSDFLLFDVAASFNQLDPADVPHSFSDFCDGVVDGIFDAGWRGADDFEFLINVSAHGGV